MVLGREERHESRRDHADNVADRDHEHTRVLEVVGDETGDHERNDLERAAGAVEQGGVERVETHVLDLHKVRIRSAALFKKR